MMGARKYFIVVGVGGERERSMALRCSVLCTLWDGGLICRGVWGRRGDGAENFVVGACSADVVLGGLKSVLESLGDWDGDGGREALKGLALRQGLHHKSIWTRGRGRWRGGG